MAAREGAHIPFTQVDPATHAAVVTPSDSVDLTNPSRAVLVGVGGTLTVDTVGGDTNVTMTVPAGVLPLMVTRIYSTGTAATNLVVLW